MTGRCISGLPTLLRFAVAALRLFAPLRHSLTFWAVQVADVDEAAGQSSDTSETDTNDLSGVEVIRVSRKKQRQQRRKQLQAHAQQMTSPGNAPRTDDIRSEYWDVETSFAWDADLARVCGRADGR